MSSTTDIIGDASREGEKFVFCKDNFWYFLKGIFCFHKPLPYSYVIEDAILKRDVDTPTHACGYEVLTKTKFIRKECCFNCQAIKVTKKEVKHIPGCGKYWEKEK